VDIYFVLKKKINNLLHTYRIIICTELKAVHKANVSPGVVEKLTSALNAHTRAEEA
jgi:hypothetical protein